MVKDLTRYRTLLKQLLQKYADFANRSSPNAINTIAVFDEEHDHYFIHTIGWRDLERIWITTLYLRLYEGKFYIEIDWTEEGIATELLAAGVPKEDIVLAFHHPSMRPYTEFAVA